MSLLQVNNLRVSFGGDDGRTVAVDSVDLNVQAGDVLGLVGESGCGKSTVALALLGLLPGAARIDRGSIQFAEHNLVNCSERQRRALRGRRIAMVFQDPMTSLNPYLRVGAQLTEAMRLHLKLDKDAAKARAIDLLTRVGIPDAASRMQRHPHEFSGGQRQRIGIAMALACDPELLIADEPTTALDVTIQAQILDLLRDLQQERGMAMILVSHDLGVIAGSCDQVAVMYAGRIVETASTKQLFAHPTHPYTRGLLASIPRLNGARGEDLATIPGLPPRLSDGWQGCAFAPRCAEADASCSAIDCPLAESTAGHRHRCAKLFQAEVPDA